MTIRIPLPEEATGFIGIDASSELSQPKLDMIVRK